LQHIDSIFFLEEKTCIWGRYGWCGRCSVSWIYCPFSLLSVMYFICFTLVPFCYMIAYLGTT